MHSDSLSHIDPEGKAAMVDVSSKPLTLREAIAEGVIFMQSGTLDAIESNQMAKGNVFATARLAGIMGAKKTGEWIPLCHPLPITHCEVDCQIPPSRDRITIRASARITAATGVEMEALCGVNAGLLCAWDMLKSVEKDADGQYPAAQIDGVRVLRKSKGDPHD